MCWGERVPRSDKSGDGQKRVEVKVLVDPEVWKQVRVRAILTDRTIGDVVNDVLRRASRQWLGPRGLGAGGPSAAPSQADEGESGPGGSSDPESEDGEGEDADEGGAGEDSEGRPGAGVGQSAAGATVRRRRGGRHLKGRRG